MRDGLEGDFVALVAALYGLDLFLAVEVLGDFGHVLLLHKLVALLQVQLLALNSFLGPLTRPVVLHSVALLRALEVSQGLRAVHAAFQFVFGLFLLFDFVGLLHLLGHLADGAADRGFLIELLLGLFKRALLFFELPHLSARLHPELTLFFLVYEFLDVDDLHLELDAANFEHVVLSQHVVLLHAAVQERPAY